MINGNSTQAISLNIQIPVSHLPSLRENHPVEIVHVCLHSETGGFQHYEHYPARTGFRVVLHSTEPISVTLPPPRIQQSIPPTYETRGKQSLITQRVRACSSGWRRGIATGPGVSLSYLPLTFSCSCMDSLESVIHPSSSSFSSSLLPPCLLFP